ncbi:MAG TPA: aminotransferase class V-fold PLP-dependent enzyme [Anaerovoracaceae bacterium]|nr:aminotransferase class V-fold PLP-dependent enzyme [Anaerovoracaceae bacterium]
MIYLDNAATSWPKPESVYTAADRAARECAGNPGRSGHGLSMAAGRILRETRMLTARFFNAPDAERLVFTLNATDALNLAIHGLLAPGGHVITSSLEHNSVARPLEALRRLGVRVTKLPADPVNGLDPAQVCAAISADTRLVAVTHVANTTGTVNPIAEIGAICRERSVLLLVDAAQSAGTRPVDIQGMNIDLLAFPGHKGLLGPQGTGGLYIGINAAPRPMREGGTGSLSHMLEQPDVLPDRYESGTPNVPGLAGLAAGIRYISDLTPRAILEHEAKLANRLIDGLAGIPGIRLYGPPACPGRSGVVSFTIHGVDTVEASMIMDQGFGIAVRYGLHCAPDAHRTLGTLETGGTIRVSAGCMNTETDIELCLEAAANIASMH